MLGTGMKPVVVYNAVFKGTTHGASSDLGTMTLKKLLGHHHFAIQELSKLTQLILKLPGH